MKKLYLVKDKKERIFGPYTEQEICFYIEDGELKGDEFFSSYPTGKWEPLSTHPVFYEKIISQLNRSDKESSASQKALESSFESLEHKDQEDLEPTRVLKLPDEKSSEKKKVKIKLSQEFREEVLLEEGADDIIEMEKTSHTKITERVKSVVKQSFRYVVLAVCIAALGLAFIFSGEKNQKSIRLAAPLKKRAAFSEKAFKAKLKQAFISFNNSAAVEYLKAQEIYVELLSADSSRHSFYVFLCLIHLELWPFSNQDSKDKQSLKRVLNLVQKTDSSRDYANFCLAVKSYIDKNFEELIAISNRLLDNSSDKIKPIFIFYLKAKALRVLNLEKQAISFLDSIFILEPGWIAPILLKADIYYNNQQYSLASKEYQRILKIFPTHPIALLRLGNLEYKYFRKPEKSRNTLEKAFSKSVKGVGYDLLFEAYVALSNIYFNDNNKRLALKYATRAYALYPKHLDIVKLKFKLKDEESFKNTRINGRALIYKGDLFVNQGNCLQAIEEFKKAYKVSRSGLAALKQAKCHWQLGATGSAIRWLKRSVQDDSQMLESYFLLSHYLSQLYAFEQAKEILNSASRNHPSSADLFKAYAQLAFRQKNYNQTIAYSKRALKFYSFDIDIYVMLSRSYLALDNLTTAHFYAKKAIDESSNHVQAQISYALTLDAIGVSYGTEAYYRKLLEDSASALAYRQALGEYLFEKEDYEKAREEFELLISENPKLKSAYIYLGLIYSELSLKNRRYYDEAIKQFREASLLDLSDPQILFYMGKTHLNHKNYNLAYQEFSKILQINSNYPLIHYYIGLTFLHRGGGMESLDKALESAHIEAAKNPHHYLPYKLAGDIYKLKSKQAFEDDFDRQKMYNLCSKEYQKALKYLKRDIEISMNLLQCYKGAGHFDIALQLAETLTREEGLSGYPDVYREIGSIFEQKEEYEKANSSYQKYFQLKPFAEDRVQIERRINGLIKQKKSLTEPEKG